MHAILLSSKKCDFSMKCSGMINLCSKVYKIEKDKLYPKTLPAKNIVKYKNLLFS